MYNRVKKVLTPYNSVQFAARISFVLSIRHYKFFYLEKRVKKYLKRILFVCVHRGVIKFSPGLLSELPTNFFFRFCVGISKLRNIGVGVHKENNEDVYIYIYSGSRGTRKMFNLMTNEAEAAKFEDCRNGESFFYPGLR